MLAWVSLLRDWPWKSAPPLRPGAVLRSEALHRRPGLDQRAVDAEVVGGQHPFDLRVGQNGGQELVRHVAGQQPVAVLAEGRLVPGRVIDPQASRPSA